MNPNLTVPAVENKPAGDDGFADEVGGIIDTLPDDLDGPWLAGLSDDDEWFEENGMLLAFAFWDAGRVVIEAMLRAGYTLTPPKN